MEFNQAPNQLTSVLQKNTRLDASRVTKPFTRKPFSGLAVYIYQRGRSHTAPTKPKCRTSNRIPKAKATKRRYIDIKRIESAGETAGYFGDDYIFGQ